jgi:hypothetical protein
LLSWSICSLHATFQARYGNLCFGVFLIFVIYLCIFCNANISIGLLPSSNIKGSGYNSQQVSLGTFFESPQSSFQSFHEAGRTKIQ